MISNMVLGLLDQLQIFWRLQLIELLGLLIGLELLELQHFIYPGFLTGFDMLVFFTNSIKSYGISGRVFGLILSFLINRRLRVVLDGKSSQEYPVNVWSSGLVVMMLDCQSSGPGLPTTRWLQDRLSLSSIRGRWNE